MVDVRWKIILSVCGICSAVFLHWKYRSASVLDEYYWLNKHDPNYSLCRATEKRGEDAHTDGKFRLSQKGSMEIMKLFFTRDEDLYDKTIEDFFDDEVFEL